MPSDSKVWLITGSSRGLGRALAEAVLAAGHRLVATARNPAQLADLVECYGDQVRAVLLDVTDERAAAQAIEATGRAAASATPRQRCGPRGRAGGLGADGSGSAVAGG
jgi:NAD(P)-dependent dehydrogenase (short-subunit alcohol dehydrogenase family)